MVVSLTPRYCLDRANIYVTGLSAGGAMAAAMLATYPEMFKAGAIIAGLPFGTASNVPEAFDRMRGHGIQEGRILAEKVRQASNHQGPWPAVSVWHGTADRTVDPINMEAIIGQWWHQHDLKVSPRITSQSQRHQCRSWSDNAGVTRVEAHTISGMGHGTPIKPGANGLGTPSAFMLDVGISSTWHIANSWNLIGERKIPPVEVAVTSCPPGARDEGTSASQSTSAWRDRRCVAGSGLDEVNIAWSNEAVRSRVRSGSGPMDFVPVFDAVRGEAAVGAWVRITLCLSQQAPCLNAANGNTLSAHFAPLGV